MTAVWFTFTLSSFKLPSGQNYLNVSYCSSVSQRLSSLAVRCQPPGLKNEANTYLPKQTAPILLTGGGDTGGWSPWTGPLGQVCAVGAFWGTFNYIMWPIPWLLWGHCTNIIVQDFLGQSEIQWFYLDVTELSILQIWSVLAPKSQHDWSMLGCRK